MALCVTRQGRVVFANDAFRELPGVRPHVGPGGLEGMSLSDAWPVDGVRMLLRMVREGRYPKGNLVRVPLPDGAGFRWISVSVAPATFDAGPAALWWASDATKIKAAEREAREASIYLRAVLEVAQDALFDLDLAADEIRCTGRALHMLGRRIAGFALWEGAGDFSSTWCRIPLPQAWSQVWYADRAALVRAIERSGEHREPLEWTGRVRRAQGGWIWMTLRGGLLEPMAGPSGGTRFVGTIRDVTVEQQQAEAMRAAKEEADAANRAKSAFLAMMSHELRTPLTALMGNVELLAARLDGDDGRLARRAWEGGSSVLAIIDDLLDLQRLESGRVSFEVTPTPLRRLVEGVCDSFRPSAERRGLALDAHVDASLDWVATDPTRLRQVLVNLVANAIKFTEEGGIRVRVQDEGPEAGREDGAVRVRFEVQDSGIGLDAEAKARLFRAFAQADPSITRRFGGSGLGLAICKGLVEALGGRIDLDSAGPGQGTTAWFQLPLVPVEAPRQEAKEPVAAVDGLTVLVIDDTPTVLETVGLQLDHLQVTGITATDGRSGLQRFLDHPEIGVVLVDLHMPGMDGWSVIQRLREIEAENARPRTRILALTADVQVAAAGRRLLDVGADGYLLKPVALDELRRALARDRDGARKPAGTTDGAAPATADARAPVVDRTLLREILGVDPDSGMLAGLVQRLVKASEPLLADMEAALEAGDPERLATAAHALKGGARSMAAVQLGNVAEELQHGGRAGRLPADLAPVRAALDELQSLADSLAGGHGHSLAAGAGRVSGSDVLDHDPGAVDPLDAAQEPESHQKDGRATEHD